jgi:acetolactate synthase-1/2/3 large subunit
VITNGAGNYTLWVHRFYPYRGLGSQLAPTSGSMGYGLPAAIAAKLAYPERPAICFAGDGCFLMTGQELATAVKYGADVIVILVNNGSYGSIRMHQERQYDGRRFGTDLVNPDFVMLARAFGAGAERVERTEDFRAAFQRARASRKPFLIELALDAAILRP